MNNALFMNTETGSVATAEEWMEDYQTRDGEELMLTYEEWASSLKPLETLYINNQMVGLLNEPEIKEDDIHGLYLQADAILPNGQWIKVNWNVTNPDAALTGDEYEYDEEAYFAL